jgi:hypothetical protein
MRQNIIDQLKQGVSSELIADEILEGIGLLNTESTTEPIQDMFRETDEVPTQIPVVKTRETPQMVNPTFYPDGHAETISVFIEFDADNSPVSITLNPNVGGKEYKTSKSIMGSDTLHIVSDKTGIILITECMVKVTRHQNLSTTTTTLDV